MFRFGGRRSWLVSTRAVQADITGWGTAAETEAQWCHPIKISELSARDMLLTSWNIVPHNTGVLARALIVIR